MVPLVRNVTVFALQYTVAVLAAVDSRDATTAMVGRAALLRQYFRLRRADIAA